MKKDSQRQNATNSSKSNIVIPLVLLLVSAIVIIATFYEDGYDDLVAEANLITETPAEAPKSKTPSMESAAVAENTEVNIIDENNVATAPEAEAAATEIQAVAENAEAANTDDIKVSSAETDVITQQTDDRISSRQARTSNIRERMQTTYAPFQPIPYTNNEIDQPSYEQTRKDAMARSQELAKIHNERRQQRRLTYENEMQTRRQQHEAVVKAQEERRAKFAEAQKAVFQRVEQNRLENAQKIKQMHEQISKMHDEIHQIMRESQPHYRYNDAPQLQPPAAEQLQSI
jgi:hypothetical protein